MVLALWSSVPFQQKNKERIPYQSYKCLGNPDVYDGLSERELLLVLEMRAL